MIIRPLVELPDGDIPEYSIGRYWAPPRKIPTFIGVIHPRIVDAFLVVLERAFVEGLRYAEAIEQWENEGGACE